MQTDLLRRFLATIDGRFERSAGACHFAAYRDRPEAFAAEVLGSRWWSRQRDVARALASSRRVAVKSANGVGKTYLAADLTLWYLYAHSGSIVLTTAPTARQVRNLLWEEIRRRYRGALSRLPGCVTQTAIRIGEGWFAVGLATDEAVRFQGFHAASLLVVLDEASGVADAIWDAAEGVAVGEDNRILAIGNPLAPTGRFYRVFQAPGVWTTLTISALEHPNVTGTEDRVPGAVTADAIDARVAEWCEPGDGDGRDVFRWRGAEVRPNGLFRSRVLGEFPEAAEDALIELRWVEAAESRGLSAEGGCHASADVARFGGDCTVLAVRRGPVVTRLTAVRGEDTMCTVGRIVQLAYEEVPETIAVDSVGLGAGVLDRLVEQGIAGVTGVNVALPATDRERFANARAELYWGLRERLRAGEIVLPSDPALREELTAIRYRVNSRGQIEIEGKDEMRRRGMRSPDRADALMLLFAHGDGTGGIRAPSSASRRLREEMTGW